MWPKLLDLTQDECRGILRRMELESYSNVIGAFRAQGTLNAVKLRILKDLRDAFHISDARHKAEVRRVVNDESLSTIAKMTYGPNTEIEWSKEGSRGFLILNRKPGQTALSAIANKASELGDTLNKNLKSPAQTNRQRTLHIDNDGNSSADKIVTNDATNVQSIKKANVVQMSSVVQMRKKDSNKQQQQQQQQNSSASSVNEQQPNSKVALTNNSTSITANGFTTTTTTNTVDKIKQSELLKVMEMPTPTPIKMVPSAAAVTIVPRTAPKPIPITSNPISRRRKSISTLVANHSPAKAMMISNRRDTMIETCPKIREHQPPEPPLHRTEQLVTFQHKKPVATNNVRTISKLELPSATSTSVFATKSSPNPLHPPAPLPLPPSQKKHMPNTNDDVQIIEAFVPHNVGTIKGTRNVMNAISQGAQLVKVIDSKIIKQPVTISNMYVTAPAKSTVPAPVQIQQQQKQQFGSSMKTSHIEYLTAATDPVRLSKFVGSKGRKIEVISLPPPSARNPNIVRNTSDKTIMHVSPHLLSQKSNQIIRTTATSIGGGSGGSGGIITSNSQNHHTIAATAATTPTTAPTSRYQQNKNHIVQVVPSQPRMVTIHPNSTILNVPTDMTTINEPPAEYIYEETINDWQNYDPSHIEQPNGYMKIINRPSQTNASNIEHDYQNHESLITENIIYDEDEENDDDGGDYIITDTEEYITMDNVIEMETDGGGTIYTANDNVVTFVSNNVIGS